METRQIHVRDLSTVTGIQQYEHEVQSIYFLGLEDFVGTIYLSMESDEYSNEAVPLTSNTFIIGQPMTIYNTTYTCQIYGVLDDGEKIQLSKRFRLIVYKSNNIQGDSEEYPIDPNFENSIIEFVNEQKAEIDTYTDAQKSEIEATGEAVIASIPSDYTALEQATYNAYPTESEAGNPIYFDDGADDIPVKELIVNLEPKQSGSGDPSPSNVRPISGHDGVVVKRTGKNILKIEGTTTTTGGITFTVNSNGTITVNGTATSNAWFTVQIIQKAFNADMYLSGCNSKNENIRLQVNIDNRAYQCTDEPIFIQSGKVIDTVLIRIASGTTVNNEVFDPMLRVANSTPYFFAYKGQEYSITFPTDVGTVYGGKLNVTTGVLTVDRYYLHVDPTKIPDNYIHFDVLTNNARVGSMRFDSHFNAPFAKYDASLAKMGAISNWLSERLRGYSVDETGFYIYDYRSFYMFFPKNIFSAQTATAFKQYLTDNPLYICYELQTPTTIQLTPTEVSTLLGSNTIQSDGSINLTYRADISKVIEKLTNAIVSLGGNV